jgi:hypothetical protein
MRRRFADGSTKKHPDLGNKRSDFGKKHKARAPLTLSKKEFRSRVTTGTDILPHLDGRGQLARRFRDIQASIIQDCGGPENCCETLLQLIRTTAGLVILREELDAKSCMGERIDISAYVRISGALRRCLSTLGLTRVPRNITPDLDDYLADKFARSRNTHPVIDEIEEFAEAEG